MAESESSIERNLIEQLTHGESQWEYRPDLDTEEKLWENLRRILENNNRSVLGGEPLSDIEFEQVKNQLSFPSFYAAAKWIAGENGIAHVSVQRGADKLQLMVLNRAHNNGGSSVYQVINQYRALKDKYDTDSVSERDRRFDVSLLINGIPLVHIELKNREHPYMDAFNQIKKYIREDKFTGIFSAVQMFVVSNASDTRYIAASDHMNEKFLTSWCDEDNRVVSNYIEFADKVLRIPEAHQLVTQYTIMDNENRNLIILRPYQIHAIESVARASKQGKSGFVWHTTGSGKTMTSYKTARNLLLDIPSIDKTIFLVDRRDLDNQTAGEFRSYAENDIIDVDDTDNTLELKRKLLSSSRLLIVTTRQKLQTLINRWLKEDTRDYDRIKKLRVAFVVDECHRTLSPESKRSIERFFTSSLWYGFTGTPRFGENAYDIQGDLPRTTEELYGPPLHEYTVQNAIHDGAVLGFSVEHLGPKGLETDADGNEVNEDDRLYDSEQHMLAVLDKLLNKSAHKLGFQNGSGRTYEAILTTSSIAAAQRYYKLLKEVKAGEKSLKISEDIRRVLPDFPKFAITYSVTENDERSGLNQQEMAESIADYNEMFGTSYTLAEIDGYNTNLNDRLARKLERFQSRAEQLDLVIVVDRLLTGFNAPCLSTLCIDRAPMKAHDIIQAFSRTNRIFDRNKPYGYIMTFRSPGRFKNEVDRAVLMYSKGGEKTALAPDWEDSETAFIGAIAGLRAVTGNPDVIPAMSKKEKKAFIRAFRQFDYWYAQVKSFTNFADKSLIDYGMTDEMYEKYVGQYKNVLESLRLDEKPVDDVDDKELEYYELRSYEAEVIDYEYITALIQMAVDEPDEDTKQKLYKEVEEYVDTLAKTNSKLADLMRRLLIDIVKNEDKYKDKRVAHALTALRESTIEKTVQDFSKKWHLNAGDVMFAAEQYRRGADEIPGIGNIKKNQDYDSYKSEVEKPMLKFQYRTAMAEALRTMLSREIVPIRDGDAVYAEPDSVASVKYGDTADCEPLDLVAETPKE